MDSVTWMVLMLAYGCSAATAVRLGWYMDWSGIPRAGAVRVVLALVVGWCVVAVVLLGWRIVVGSG